MQVSEVISNWLAYVVSGPVQHTILYKHELK